MKPAFVAWLSKKVRGRRPSPLKIELKNLRKNYEETDDVMRCMEAQFWRNGGVCCPSCGMKEYRDLGDKQERRLQRIEQIKNKLARNTPKPTQRPTKESIGHD